MKLIIVLILSALISGCTSVESDALIPLEDLRYKITFADAEKQFQKKREENIKQVQNTDIKYIFFNDTPATEETKGKYIKKLKKELNRPYSNEWIRFKAKFKEEDELWFYSSPKEDWDHWCGEEGYALVRNGVPIDTHATLIQ